MPHRILVVDDQEAVRALLRDWLVREQGCEVLEADSGLAAVQLLHDLGAAVAVDLVLTDFDMPLMTSLELVGFIKTDPVLAALPVVMLSSHAEVYDRERVLGFGVAAFVAKPFTVASLRPHLLAALSRT